MSRLLGKQGHSGWEASGIDGRTRPDQVTPEQWALLAQILLPENGPAGKDE